MGKATQQDFQNQVAKQGWYVGVGSFMQFLDNMTQIKYHSNIFNWFQRLYLSIILYHMGILGNTLENISTQKMCQLSKFRSQGAMFLVSPQAPWISFSLACGKPWFSWNPTGKPWSFCPLNAGNSWNPSNLCRPGEFLKNYGRGTGLLCQAIMVLLHPIPGHVRNCQLESGFSQIS